MATLDAIVVGGGLNGLVAAVGGREYAVLMESILPWALVTVVGDGGDRDGIVFDSPSAAKVVVAVVDPRRGPLFRTVHPRQLSERNEAGPDDAVLRGLLRRTPPPGRGDARGGKGAGHEQAAHARTAMHRTTGK